MAADPLQRVREICLALPDTKETLTWGSPYFRVGDKIFAGYGEQDGRPSVGFKLEKPHAEAIVADPRFTPSQYVGRHGWVTMDLADIGGLGPRRGPDPGELPRHRAQAHPGEAGVGRRTLGGLRLPSGGCRGRSAGAGFDYAPTSL